jgi:hypothetical protein
VPTDLGLVSHQVQLEVLVPDVFILGPKDLIVDRGTTLSLVCIVENVREKEINLHHLNFYFLFLKKRKNERELDT